ncbi:erythromycin esterase family protein [Actinomadura roseirufa]|uniref:erythromycin esterase family protein n=1 Tax=Actinomadura roseirufa TaxID=2094049 RepID=UPI0010417815|nr:erythromycin esterase family protein [Actinomadura roseirufa]
MTTTSPLSRRSFLAASAVAAASVPLLGGNAKAVPRSPRPSGDPVAALRAAAHPLRTTEPTGPLWDLRPLAKSVENAAVVGVGETTHGSHEFFTMKHRVFRYLVEHKGFTTFALETGWSTGLRINDFVLHGKGDLRTIMDEEFAGAGPWYTHEWMDLFLWMRDHNLRYSRKVQFMGDDMNAPTLGKELTHKVVDYVRDRRPDLVPRFEESYARLRSLKDFDALVALPLAERIAINRGHGEAYDLLTTLRPEGEPEGEAFHWTLQHARSIVQTTTLVAFDLTDAKEVSEAMKFRDGAMAENVDWWYRTTGEKVVVSAHGGHIGYIADDAERYTKTQGAFLRERLGDRYVNLGFTFYQGSFNATTPPDPEWKRHTLGPPVPGSNEETLDKVASTNYYLDTRTAPAEAREWLAQKRTTRTVGTGWPEPPYQMALGPTFDVLIHLHAITASNRL